MAVTSRQPGRLLNTLRVADAMTFGVISCSPETPLRTVAQMMSERRVHAVYVFDDRVADEPVALWGLVSDIDLVAAARCEIDMETAHDVSITPLVTVFADDTLDHASRLMAEYSVSHLAVLSPTTEEPVGVLSTLDVARVIAG